MKKHLTQRNAYYITGLAVALGLLAWFLPLPFSIFASVLSAWLIMVSFFIEGYILGQKNLFNTYWEGWRDGRNVPPLGQSRPITLTVQSCPEHLMDGRNEIRCWLEDGHQGPCK